MSVFLCGQTGNINRGCEAIIRSTVKVLHQRSGDIYLATFAPKDDAAMARELGINLLSYGNYPTQIHRYFCAAWRKVLRRSVCGTGIISKPLYSRMRTDDISLNIGGDTYCYGRPMYSIALNRFTAKKGIRNCLWCCSIEKDVLKGEVLSDLNRYSYIFPREQISYQNLLAAGIPKEKLIQVCDPAFFLDRKEVPLPQGFAPGNTVGLNISECVIGADMPLAYENVLQMARYILDHTDMSICLIPHVYRIEQNRNDWPILNRLFKDLNDKRVSIVAEEYDCEQLKYIISQCRFMVCARTHASIAAYSSQVPTLVLGYSVKSKGIATDLFGTDEKYVIAYQDLKRTEEMTEAFQYIVAHEQQIRQQLHDILPQYKQQLLDAIKHYIVPSLGIPSSICDPELCTGCGACSAVCPKNCIQMKPDAEGFRRPYIDEQSCIHCDRCRKICPSANRKPDNNRVPKVYGAMHKNGAIRMQSSSGGVFTALAEKVIENGGVVFGAAFDENFNVVHKWVHQSDQLTLLQGSKYVQSQIGNTYAQAKSFLEQGKLVLFSGTPCQISGLYAYLGKAYENLFTVDVVCHGVPSPKLWTKYLAYQKKRAAADIAQVSMRSKNSGWKVFSMNIAYANGETYTQALTADPYLKGFLSDLYLRPSCHLCPNRTVHRPSDITLADYWNVNDTCPEKNDDKGISVIMVHSEKGAAWVDQCRDELTVWSTTYEDLLRGNPSTLYSKAMPALRKAFWQDVDRLEIDKLIAKYLGSGVMPKARRIWAKLK